MDGGMRAGGVFLNWLVIRDPTLSALAVRVYCACGIDCSQDNRPPVKDMPKYFGCSPEEIQEALKALAAKGLLVKVANGYRPGRLDDVYTDDDISACWAESEDEDTDEDESDEDTDEEDYGE
jgi:hypothetical protein